MIILHGDDYVSSRNQLNELADEARQKNQVVNRLEAADLELGQLTQLIESRSFFGEDNLIIIFGLLSQVKSKKKDKIIEYLKKNQEASLILYESKEVTQTNLKVFPKAKVIHYKPAPVIFDFLDNIKPGNPRIVGKYQELLDLKTEPEFIFAMLVRQVRLLIQATEPTNLKTAPWIKNKLIAQARSFGLDRLLKLHEKLYQIDKNIKTGKNPVNLSLQIFNLLLNL
ncbi:hypothetical protein HYS10_01985 [Candidatus Collierbacteria bacterium]|nr:hypothetical protein [Candidatus Collierbacteria bacterium]